MIPTIKEHSNPKFSHWFTQSAVQGDYYIPIVTLIATHSGIAYCKVFTITEPMQNYSVHYFVFLVFCSGKCYSNAYLVYHHHPLS